MAEPTSNPDRTPRISSPSASAFVGRQREMSELKAVLEESISGQGRLVMLTGEPGIGKTRIAQELAAAAQAKGMKVLWGRCYEGLGAPPFWPWVQAIRGYVQQTDPETLRSEMGSGAADIAAIIPEISAKLPGLEAPPQLEPDQARFRLFDSIATFLKNSAASDPLALVLDDLHWADRSSLHLLEFLAKELATSRLLVIGTYRDLELTRQHPLEESLAQLVREPVFHRYSLQGLDPEDTQRFIEDASDGTPSPAVVTAIHTHTEGNPFFLSEVIRLLTDNSNLQTLDTGDVPRLGIPTGVREVIGRRLNRLSDSCNRMLSAAAVAGREFEFGLVRELLPQLAEDQLLKAIDEALWARLIGESEAGRERYQFSHALVQQTLLEELSASRRARLHAQIAEWLESRHGTSGSEHAGELAYHFGEAQSVLEEGAGTEKLVHYSLLAGDTALNGYAWEEALAYFQRGLSAKGIALTGSDPAEDADTASLLFGFGRSQAATLLRYQQIDAANNLQRAFDYFAATGDVGRATAAAGAYPRGISGHRFDLANILSKAISLVLSGARESGRLWCRYGRHQGQDNGDYKRAEEAFGHALDIAHNHSDVALEMQTLIEAGCVAGYHNNWHESFESIRRAIDLASRVDAPYMETPARFWVALGSLAQGDLEGARHYSSTMLTVAERIRENFWQANALWRQEMVSSLEGDWQAARGYSDRAMNFSSNDPRPQSTRTRLEYESGNFDEGSDNLERMLDLMRRSAPGATMENVCSAGILPIVARISGTEAPIVAARTAAKNVLDPESANPLYAAHARAGLGLLAHLQDDAAAAAEQYAHLAPLRGTLLVFALLSIDRLLGLLARTMGEPVRAKEHFDDALSFCRKAGYRPELAWTCHDYAESLLWNDGDRDLAKALALLDESLTISTVLGMRPLAEKVALLQASATTAPAAGTRLPDGLTQREVEVLRLIGAGRTDREIADELMIAPRTATTHVGHILSKTDSANRAEAAVYAARRGLA